MAELGRAALVVSFALALYACVAGTLAAVGRQRRLADSARSALIACFGSTLVASAVLATALVRHDFTFRYVADHTSRDLSPIYSLTAFWGGEEGSLLLWLLVLTGYGALAVALNRKPAKRTDTPEDLVARAHGRVFRALVADADPEVHRVLLDKVFPRQAAVVDTDEWIETLSGH